MSTERIRPFSNGHEFDMWYSYNCEGCIHDRDLEQPTVCEIQNALFDAMMGDGKISKEIADKAGEFYSMTDLGYKLMPCKGRAI